VVLGNAEWRSIDIWQYIIRCNKKRIIWRAEGQKVPNKMYLRAVLHRAGFVVYVCTFLAKKLSSWCWVYRQMLIVPQLVKILPSFYGTWRFITVFTTAQHLSPSWARSIHSTPTHPVSLRSILILSSIYVRVYKTFSFLRFSYQHPMHINIHFSPHTDTRPSHTCLCSCLWRYVIESVFPKCK
jgi:hypothetical protein